jgi:putative transcriptional regulator
VLALIDKGEDENLSKAERNELRIELAGYADDYRKGVIEKVAALSK